jgi:hypothetical protein
MKNKRPASPQQPSLSPQGQTTLESGRRTSLEDEGTSIYSPGMRENCWREVFGEKSGSDYDTDEADLWTDSDYEDKDSSSLPLTS